MRTFLEFAYATLPEAGHSAFEDGQFLAERCHRQLAALGDPAQFPPKLLILLVSPAYFESANALAAGIQQFFTVEYRGSVPMIGSSVAAVFADGAIHERGTLLICLASRLLHVKVEAAVDLGQNPQDALRKMLKRLDLDVSSGQDPNPRANRTVLVFLPRYAPGCSPDDLYQHFSEALMYRLPVTGAVSHSDNPAHDPGIQFTENGAHQGALVAARIEFQIPLASSLGRSLKPTGKYVSVDDSRSPTAGPIAFEGGEKPEQLADGRNFVVLGYKDGDRYVAAMVLTRVKDAWSRQTLRKVAPEHRLQVLQADPQEIVNRTVGSVVEAKMRSRLENPIASIAFQCNSYYRFRNEIGLDIIGEIQRLEQALNGAHVVGGFFNGEIGVDRTGQSILANWAGAALIFGDEMRVRSAWQRAFQAIADRSASLNKAESLEEAIDASLAMVLDAGYPGAMISLVLEHGDNRWVIGHSARGPRFQKLLGSTRHDLHSKHFLATAARRIEKQYIAAVRLETDAPGQASFSQYVIPLRSPSKKTFALLHIDLGYTAYKNKLHEVEEKVLDALGAAVESSLVRVRSWVETTILRVLDEAMARALSADSVEAGRQQLIEAITTAFETKSGYIRILDESGHHLRIVAGLGDYYEAARMERVRIDATYESPTGEAFVRVASKIVNDSQEEPAHRQLQEYYRDNPRMTAALERARSYAISVLKDGAGTKYGTVAILADRPWFFHAYHARCLEMLAERLGFLARHLELKFLSQIGIDSSSQLGDASLAFKALVTRFREAAAAQVVSLYILDSGLDKFVLRASSGWSEKGWEHAAWYAEHEGWTGSFASADQPRYEESLLAYKRSTGRSEQGTYAAPMFGPHLAKRLTNEGLALPLKTAGEPIGVLTAYRLYNPANRSQGFTTTDPAVLHRAADRISRDVAATLFSESERLKREAQSRRANVYEVISLALKNGDHLVLCRHLAKAYGAERAFFFFVSDRRDEDLVCRSSYPGPPQAPDETVARVFEANGSDIQTTRISESFRLDRAVAATEGAVRRACFGVPVGGDAHGVLDLYWPDGVPRSAQPVNRHDIDELHILAHILGSLYHRHLVAALQSEAVTRERKSNDKAVAMGAMVTQVHHVFTNVLSQVKGLKEPIIEGRSSEIILCEIDKILKNCPQLIERPLKLVRSAVDAEPTAELLASIIEDVAEEGCRRRACEGIEIRVKVPPHLYVLVNRPAVLEAFLNLFVNAIDATRRGSASRGPLTISAYESSANDASKHVSVDFEDKGIGMTEDEIKAALDGFVPRPGKDGLGVGILLAKVLLAVQNCSLKIKSTKDVSTKATVTLPMGNSRT